VIQYLLRSKTTAKKGGWYHYLYGISPPSRLAVVLPKAKKLKEDVTKNVTSVTKNVTSVTLGTKGIGSHNRVISQKNKRVAGPKQIF